MISDLYKSEMIISEISSEYGIVKSPINDWIKVNKEIKVSEDEIITLKELKWIKLKRKMKYLKKL